MQLPRNGHWDDTGPETQRSQLPWSGHRHDTGFTVALEWPCRWCRAKTDARITVILECPPMWLGHSSDRTQLDGCYYVVLHSSAEYAQSWRHLANDSKVSDTLKWNLYNEFTMLPPKWVKGDLHICHRNVASFEWIFSSFHMLHHLVMTSRQMKHCQIFGEI